MHNIIIICITNNVIININYERLQDLTVLFKTTMDT
jgi:hypothetical protein